MHLQQTRMTLARRLLGTSLACNTEPHASVVPKLRMPEVLHDCIITLF